MQPEKVKTTLYIEKKLYYEGKKTALDKQTTTTELINEALAYYLRMLEQGNLQTDKRKNRVLPAKKMGKTGNLKLSRQDIYDFI